MARLQAQQRNLCLVALVDNAGFRSYDRFAEAVNAQAWHQHGLRLSYDHVSVKRWIAGGTCQYPEMVAEVLSTAWGIPITPQIIWPHLRKGAAGVPAHEQAWAPARTLADLGFFMRSDMLTRREVLTSSVEAVTGAALLDPLQRWLAVPPIPVTARTSGAHVGLTDVKVIEAATVALLAGDVTWGGGPKREAAVGELKYAVDLMQHGSYTEPVGDRLLAAISALACTIGWMSFDVGMDGPAQQYSVYALQAACESRYARAILRPTGTLFRLARYQHAAGRPDTGLRLVDLAIAQLPDGRHSHNAVRAGAWNLKAQMLAALGTSSLPEMRNALDLSFELNAKSADDNTHPAVAALYPYLHDGDAELTGAAAESHLDVAAAPDADRRHAIEAERYALATVANRPARFARSRVFDHITLARTRFLLGEPLQAAADATTAVTLAAKVPSSARIRTRLRTLIPATNPYQRIPEVAHLRTTI